MSARPALVSCAIAGAFLVGCSLATSWNDLPLGPIDAPDAGTNVPDASATISDAAPDVVEAGACSGATSGYFCGPTATGIAGEGLYSCTANGGQDLVTVCTHACDRRQPSASDACECTVGGVYCGNDQIAGDPNTLYRCNPDFSGTATMTCPGRCQVNTVGKDDACE